MTKKPGQPTWPHLPVLVLNGPNLNRLGTREVDVYGHGTYDDLVDTCTTAAESAGLSAVVRQTNAEHKMIGWLHDAATDGNAVVLNAAGWTHTSVALRDAVALLGAPCIEVHISNVYAREEFRHHSYISGVATGVIAGLGIQGYAAAVLWLGAHAISSDA